MIRSPRSRRLFALAAAGALLAGCGGGESKDGNSGTTTGSLVGLFKIDPGSCPSGAVTTGSYFRMIQTGGKPTGPFVLNGDSACKDKSWSPMLPGTAGGLRTDAYQPNPSPAFDSKGNGQAGEVVQPVKWFAVSFAISTNPTDPQTKGATAKPVVVNNGGVLSGDLRAVGASWNNVYFNQGSPKPDASKTGNTTGPTGTYDPSTHRYTLDWLSQIVGGPFNNFTGVWHLEGTFVPAGS